MSDQRGFYGFRENGDSTYQSFALELVAGFRCQLRCRNCYKRQGLKKTGDGDIPSVFVKEALLQAKECGFAEAVFIGGEPTLHPKLPEFMVFASEIGLAPILCTNGIKLADAGYATSVTVPGSTLVLHAPLPKKAQDGHAGYSGYKELLSQAYDNILKKDQVTIVAEMVMIQEYIDYATELYKWCLKNSIIPFLEINRRYDNGRLYRGTSEPEEVKRIFERLAKLAPSPPATLFPPAFAQPCTMSLTGLHVKNLGGGDFGGVYSCCAQKVKHGDLRRQQLAEILLDQSLTVFKQQDEWIYGPCRSCPHYAVCRGGCRGEATLAFGCPRASCPICWHIPAEIRSDPSLMAPLTCTGCPLDGNPVCCLKR